MKSVNESGKYSFRASLAISLAIVRRLLSRIFVNTAHARERLHDVSVSDCKFQILDCQASFVHAIFVDEIWEKISNLEFRRLDPRKQNFLDFRRSIAALVKTSIFPRNFRIFY